MRAIDTNVVSRYLLRDDPEQSPIAARTMADGVFLPVTVLLELAWLLTSRYGQPRQVVAAALAEVIDLPTVDVEEAETVRWAIGRYAAGADFADMLHMSGCRQAQSFATFDRGIAANVGANPPLPVETLA